jgi:hypothetical protein
MKWVLAMSETLVRVTYNVAFLSIKEDLAHDERIIADFHENEHVFFHIVAARRSTSA